MEYNSLEMIALYQEAVRCYQQPETEKHDEGFQLLLEAAENGVTQACKMLGLLYMSGQYAPYPEIDESMAVRWWRMAAETGDEEAMFWLGQCYEDGIGVAENKEEARIWKKFAADNGFIADGDEESELPAEPEKAKVIASKEEKHKSRKRDKAKPESKAKNEKKTEKTLLKTVQRISDKEEEPAVRTNKIRTDDIKKDEIRTKENRTGSIEREKKLPHTPISSGETVTPKNSYQLKEADKKKEEEEAEATRFARQEAEARRISNLYRFRMGIGGAICCLLFLWIVLLLIYWLIYEPGKGYMSIFWIFAGLISAVSVLCGYSVGVKKAQNRIEMVAEYRKTSFYHAYGCELGQMSRQQQWCYRVYRSLAKNYFPVTYRKKVDLPELRGYRGCLYTNWIYESGNEKAQPEFVVLTEKAVYVIKTEYLTGRVQGDLMDTAWALYSDGEGDLTAQKMPNPVDENARNIRIIKEDLIQYFDLPLEQIPFYNVIFFNEEVDIKGLRRMAAEDDTLFVQGFADKLRGSLGVWESRLPTHNMGLDELIFAFEQIGRQFIKRNGW